MREAYEPMVSPLSPTSAPADIVAGLLSLAPFRTLYVADLDAIAGQGSHDGTIRALRTRHPHLELWVDAGAQTPREVSARAAAGLGTSVVGTESLQDVETARAVLSMPGVILSLDHDARGPMGPAAVHEDASLWPRRVIVMTLARVGSGEGPDLEALARVRARAPGASLIAAGGVRDATDLARLEEMAIAGVLVASALHDGRIDGDAARRYA